ncbi:hypothetical protein BROSI_A3049 [Candidatus Brocadia sinica JPN1]|uniref:Uncharacterized protein n=1 Tax=Candidatus Brocadia sinica JPN1 TaxID=1197129 RepID=A0ABQ0K189_9BACT|nr:hypothetical protein BROSI_A3049 [Candidatus Brocadia sinica JPN1]GIK11539.1 MAG: hypothetical protein BroJett002_02460 [Candidatus Brocadia sinica]GJQ17661.1 MAG: hypothetical protein HBSIN01_16200 [Candidatus Brocadia sinica]
MKLQETIHRAVSVQSGTIEPAEENEETVLPYKYYYHAIIEIFRGNIAKGMRELSRVYTGRSIKN